MHPKRVRRLRRATTALSVPGPGRPGPSVLRTHPPLQSSPSSGAGGRLLRLLPELAAFHFAASGVPQGFVAFLPVGRKALRAAKPKPYPSVPVTLGEHVKTRRIQLGLLQRELAKQLGVSEWTLRHWEKDTTTPAIRFVPRIIAFLGYDPYPEPIDLSQRLFSAGRRQGLSICELAKHLVSRSNTWTVVVVVGAHSETRRAQRHGTRASAARRDKWSARALLSLRKTKSRYLGEHCFFPGGSLPRRPESDASREPLVSRAGA